MSAVPEMILTGPQPGRPVLLARAERLVLGLRLTLALVALCLVIVAFGIPFLFPADRGAAAHHHDHRTCARGAQHARLAGSGASSEPTDGGRHPTAVAGWHHG